MFRINRELSSSEKLFAIVLCVCLGFICNSIVVSILHKYMQGDVAYKFLLILSSVLSFGLPAIIVSRIVGNAENPLSSLGMTRGVKAIIYFLAIVLMLAIMPAVEFVTSLNAAYSFPDAMKGIEEYFRSVDARTMEATQRALNGNGIGMYLMNIIALAITPAICEEMFFRGVLQKHFVVTMKSKHLAILLTALIFSVIHLQFSGLLPRFILGAVLGYLFYSTGSLWPSIIAHATNNALVVTVAFWGDTVVTEIPDVGSFASFGWIVAIVIGLVIATFIGVAIKRFK